MNEIIKEIILTISENDTRKLYSMKQMMNGRIEFSSGIVDVSTLTEDHKKEMIHCMQEMFNPYTEDAKQ